jgi:cell division septation protein DedD
MSSSYPPNGKQKSHWPVVILVVGCVAATSLALGLLVVGPMIQRRMESPPPVLSVSGTTTVAPSHAAVSSADVDIKERVVRRPPPRPAPPPSDSLNFQLGTPPASGDAATGLSDAGSPVRAKPGIKATVTDAEGDGAGPAGDPASATPGTRESRRNPRRSQDTLSPATDGAAASPAAGSDLRPRSAAVPKARTRRSSPLDALPVLDSSGAESTGDKPLPGAAPIPSSDVHPTGKSYRVQVGRFNDSQDAARLRDELSQSGLNPRVVKTQKGGATVYRVQIGTYQHKENAIRQMETLKGRSYDPYLAEDEP